MEDSEKVYTVLCLNLIGCVLACAIIQMIIALSKKMNAYYLHLKNNYKSYRFRNWQQKTVRFKETFNESKGTEGNESSV